MFLSTLIYLTDKNTTHRLYTRVINKNKNKTSDEFYIRLLSVYE